MELVEAIEKLIPQMSENDVRRLKISLDLYLGYGDELQRETMKYIMSGEIIGAVRHVKESTGLGLREAKTYVDKLRGI